MLRRVRSCHFIIIIIINTIKTSVVATDLESTLDCADKMFTAAFVLGERREKADK